MVWWLGLLVLSAGQELYEPVLIEGRLEIRVSSEVTGLQVWFDVDEAELTADRLPLLGTTSAEGDVLIFRPRFPFQPGFHYLVRLDPLDRFVAFRPPPTEAGAPVPEVAISLPRTGVPANCLRFYLEFDGPMRPLDPYDHLRLLDQSGRVIQDAFVKVHQGLWDAARKRLTVLFHPGRVKRGLHAREALGPILRPGSRYTLVVDGCMKDARGNPMGSDRKFSFEVGPEDRTALDPATWRVHVPPPGNLDPIEIDFGEAVDPAIARRAFELRPGPGFRVQLGEQGRSVRIIPDSPLTAETELWVSTRLEDLAGNRIGRVFDVKLGQPQGTGPEWARLATVR